MNTKKYKPNAKLPAGAKLLKSPVWKKVGGWLDQEYDAEMQMLGLTLYRVKDGFGSHGYREDWVIDLPTGAYAVSDTDYISGISQISKPKAKTFKGALIVELAVAKAHTINRIAEKEQELTKIKKTLNILNSVKI